MIRVRQIKIDILKDTSDELMNKILKKVNVKKEDILNYTINKKSIDARNKEKIYYVYEVDLNIKNENIILRQKKKDIIKIDSNTYEFKKIGKKTLKHRPIIVGSGPAGLFAAYMLAMYGYKPLIIERGKAIDKRIKDVNDFWQTGKLDINSNVQFGEGGAGTFSDGKLNTMIKDKNNRIKKVLEIFIENGANEEIMYLHNPHLGTNKLVDIVKNMRKNIIENGGEFLFETCLTDLVIEEGKIKSVILNNKDKIDTEVLILAIGHSARDTFKILNDRKIHLENKPFAVGLRIMHDQNLIDNNQYGIFKDYLKPASYKLTFNYQNRGIYSFCMCPGGYVVNASSTNDGLVINGMSNYERDSGIANSAIVVSINERDYGNKLFAGMYYLEELERKAKLIANGKIPVQTVGDFLENKVKSKTNLAPKIKGLYDYANLNHLFTNDINDALKKGIINFDSKIPGFADKNALLLGVESRTSSPLRILRNDCLESNISGIYPIGEGSGYAGGITSSAVDGIKAFEEICKKY